ncbi:MAG: hypothetical protein JJ992_29280 [Planctomycetes bacterium]|nr:hypothetical protein [Planctomycetota bacterium]
MYFSRSLILVTFCCALGAGCSGSRIDELTDEVRSLQAQLDKVTAENADLQAEIEKTQGDLAELKEIREGYERARTQFQKNLAALAPLLGVTESPLPPFEQLKDSSWVDRLMPGPEMKSGLDDLERQLKGLLEPAGDQPAPVQPTADPPPAE